MMRETLWMLGAPLRWAAMAPILVYRATLGRLLAGRCRFHPTCSAYALEAIGTHGALKGVALALWRVARCSPLTAGGIDRVPEAGTWHSRGFV
jgi:uncharacterized protein